MQEGHGFGSLIRPLSDERLVKEHPPSVFCIPVNVGDSPHSSIEIDGDGYSVLRWFCESGFPTDELWPQIKNFKLARISDKLTGGAGNCYALTPFVYRSEVFQERFTRSFGDATKLKAVVLLPVQHRTTWCEYCAGTRFRSASPCRFCTRVFSDGKNGVLSALGSASGEMDGANCPPRETDYIGVFQHLLTLAQENKWRNVYVHDPISWCTPKHPSAVDRKSSNPDSRDPYLRPREGWRKLYAAQWRISPLCRLVLLRSKQKP